MKHIIHTSERKDFKKCRQFWDFRSPSRYNLEPLQQSPALLLGTAVHAGLEAWYYPKTWDADKDALAASAILEFKNALPSEAYFDQDEWAADLKLGAGMLRNYFEWSQKEDTWFKPIHVEIPLKLQSQTLSADIT